MVSGLNFKVPTAQGTLPHKEITVGKTGNLEILPKHREPNSSLNSLILRYRILRYLPQNFIIFL